MKQTPKHGRRSASKRTRDPYLQREAQSYEHPLPSREFILETLAEQGVPVTQDSVEKAKKT